MRFRIVIRVGRERRLVIVVPEEWSSILPTLKWIEGQNPAYRPSSSHKIT